MKKFSLRAIILKIFLSLAASTFFFILALGFIFLKTQKANPDFFATYPLTELVYEYPWDNSFLTGEKILRGKKIEGHFRAQTNRLGTVAIKFTTFNHLNYDQIIFRLKEKGKEEWFYENAYNTDPIRQEVFWPFGFPLIADSKGKTYEFEIESLRGENEQAIAINPLQKFFITKYSYSKQWLLENKKEIPSFVLQKITSSFKRLTNKDQLLIGVLALGSLLLPFLIRELTIFLISLLSKLVKIPPSMIKKLPKSKLVKFLKFMPTRFSFVILLMTKLVNFLIFTIRVITKIVSKIFATVPFLVIVSLFLLFLATASCLLDKQVFLEDTNPRDLVYWHQWPTSLLTGGEILAGQKITGEFVAHTNRLGAISVRIYDFGRDNQDLLVFRLKEKNASEWLDQKTYKTSQMRGSLFFPFGFPLIENSKSKTYEFEIESVRGTPGNAVSLVTWEKSFISKYSYPQSWLWNHKKEILPFVLKKIVSPFTRLDQNSWSFIFTLTFIPLLIYLLGLPKIKDLNFSFASSASTQIFSFGLVKENFKLIKKNQDQEVIYKILFVLAALFVSSIILHFLFPMQTEKLEWSFYLIFASLIPITFFGLGLFLNQHNLTCKTEGGIKLVFFISFFLIFTFLFSKDLLPRQTLVFLSMALIPFLPLIKTELKKNANKSLWIKITKTTLTVFTNNYFLINLVGIFSVTSFFYETLLRSPNTRSYLLNYLFLSGFLSYLAFNYQFNYRAKLKNFMPAFGLFSKLPQMFFRLVFFVFFLVLLFLAIHREAIYYAFYSHSSYYYGPVFDILNGKSLLYDTPSQYGYLSIHFIALMEKVIGVTVASFTRLDSFLYVISTALAGLIFLKLTKNKFLSLILAFLFISFQTFFSDYNSFLYPSSGPLRFGFGVLICFFLLYFPGRLSFLAGTVLASISVFWSAEVALYTAPAWIFTVVVIAWKKSGLNREFVKEVLVRLGFLFFLILLLGLAIALKEYRPSSGWPDFYNYLQYALVYQGGYYAILIPLYGNHYFYIFISIFGLGMLFHLLTKKSSSPLLPVFSFLSFYNMTIFSYFISRSWYSLITSIAGFLVIEIVLIYKLLRETLGFSARELKAYFATPAIIFCVLFVSKCYYNNNPPVNKVIESNFKFFLNLPSETTPLLAEIANKYKLEMKNVILLSTYDTQYLTEAKIKNFLPLNPSLMTFDLPGWKGKYLDPKIKQIPAGTILIDDLTLNSNPYVSESLILIKNEIERTYELIPVGKIEDKKIEIFKIGSKRKLLILNQD